MANNIEGDIKKEIQTLRPEVLYVKNPITNAVVSSTQIEHNVSFIQHSVLEASSGGSVALSTSDSSEITFLFPKNIGTIQKLLVRLSLAQATANGLAYLSKSLTDCQIRIGGQSLGIYKPESLFYDTCLAHDFDAGAQAYLITENGMAATFLDGQTLVAAATAHFFVDITGALRNEALVVSAIDDEVRLTFRYNSSGDWITNTTGSTTVDDLELHVSYWNDGQDALHRLAYKNFDMIYLAPQSLSERTVSGTTELTRSKLDNFTGHAAYLSIMVEDVSLDIGSTSQIFSALNYAKVVNSAGIRVQSDSDSNVLESQLIRQGHDRLGQAFYPFYQTKSYIYPFSDDLRGAQKGKVNGGYHFTGQNEAITIKSTDANADNLKLIIWHWKVAKFRNNRIESILTL